MCFVSFSAIKVNRQNFDGGLKECVAISVTGRKGNNDSKEGLVMPWLTFIRMFTSARQMKNVSFLVI